MFFCKFLSPNIRIIVGAIFLMKFFLHQKYLCPSLFTP